MNGNTLLKDQRFEGGKSKVQFILSASVYCENTFLIGNCILNNCLFEMNPAFLLHLLLNTLYKEMTYVQDNQKKIYISFCFFTGFTSCKNLFK